MKCFIILAVIFLVSNVLYAVNVSNTWTMPQEGLNVFYRFFRDRISWFEADAVCQFHHANLVTVDNSFQFDATRDLLRELDVNDIVWIGLMRPQSSDRFMWSNSRALVADTGYWAESLPLMDAPLCAVIDPIRDYRWHALRCGGPETASFLCEMPVPSWADACNLKDMPNLTLQYMADTASIELIRNCQEEGLLRTMCKGKQDRERAVQDLICPRERLEAQRINDITNSHFKSLQIINSIPSDNNENNNIELLPMAVNYGPHYTEELQTEKNTVQRLIEQFNVDELMQADEPSNMETVGTFYKIPGLIPKPVKKSAKKVLDYQTKDNVKQKSTDMSVEQSQKDNKRLSDQMEEMMMGDQPAQGEPEITEQFLIEEVSNEILEPLPHIKKTNIHKEDSLEKMEKETMEIKKSIQKSKNMENKKLLMENTTDMTDMAAKLLTTTTSPISTSTSITEMLLTTTPAISIAKADETAQYSEDHTNKTHYETHTEFENNRDHLVTTTSPATIGHPIHPQQSYGTVITAESQHPHTKESTDSSYFIPPMLMVKSHYIPLSSKHGHNEHDHHQHYQQQQQLKHDEQHLHLETTTEEPAGTILKHEKNQSSDKMLTAATPPKVLSMQKTTLNTLGSILSSTEGKTVVTLNKQEQYEGALITTIEKDSSMKPITEQQKAVAELPKTTNNLHFKETETTMTTTNLESTASITARTVEKDKETLLTSKSEKINKNANKKKDKDDTQKLKSPQMSHTDAETTEATKLVATTEKSFTSTQKLYNLETATDNTEKVKEIAGTTTIETTIPTQQQQKRQQHVLTMEEKLTAIKREKNKEHLQITTEATEKLAAAQTVEVLTTSTGVSQTTTQQTPTTTKAETEKVTPSLQQIEKVPTNKEILEEDKENEQDKKETIAEKTEILQTSTALTKSKHGKEEEEQEEKDSPSTIKTTTSATTTTTVKPITTTMPQNEVKSTDTSFSFASTMTFITTTNIPITTSEDNASMTTTLTSPTSTALVEMLLASAPTTITATTTESEVATPKTETSTQTPAAPETTRNFLKVTTEIPFKPNRRRSLTKPETVSYMKKILG